MGGALLQQLNRDTQKFAFKCSNITVNGEDRDVFKDPVEGHDKASKRGRLALLFEDGLWSTERVRKNADKGGDQLETVFRDGEVLLTHSVAEIRERAASQEQVTLAT
jgi:nicotinamide phosphoribosyltransferase